MSKQTNTSLTPASIPVCHEAVSSTPTIGSNGECVNPLIINNAGEFQLHGEPFNYSPHEDHLILTHIPGDFYDAESLLEAIDPHALQLNPAHEFGSPHPLANVVAQIKELGNAREPGSPAPFAQYQQIDPALEFPAHFQLLDPALEFDSTTSSTHVPNLNSALEFSSPAPSAHDQQFYPTLEFGSPSPFDYPHQYNPSAAFDSPAPYAHVPNFASTFEFGLPNPSAHVPDLVSTFEFGLPAPTRPDQYRLDSVPPEGLEYSQLHSDTAGTEVPARITQVGVLDPRLREASILEFQNQEYDPVTGTLFPEINSHQNYIHHPEFSFPIAPTQAAQYQSPYPQTDISATLTHERTDHASGTLSPITFRHQVGEEYNGLHEDGEF